MGQERLARQLVKSVDTNVVLRLLMGDDAAQSEIATRIFERPLLLPLTVLLETAWVLGSNYRLSRPQIAAMLSGLTSRSTVTIEAPAHFGWAIDRFRAGGDIADLIHIVASRGATSFATFDRNVARAAGPDSPVPIETLVA